MARSRRGDGVALVATRDQQVITTVSELLQANGFRYEISDGNTDLIKKVLEQSYGLVILDADLSEKIPIADVVAIVRTAREKVHVVVIADQISLQMGRQLAGQGISLTLLKPVNRELLNEFLLHLRKRCALH
ncbi:MAG: response regulator [Calditrichaeota bacterium]|nr:MAG: response regulator [Calditrichota bacterium]